MKVDGKKPPAEKAQTVVAWHAGLKESLKRPGAWGAVERVLKTGAHIHRYMRFEMIHHYTRFAHRSIIMHLISEIQACVSSVSFHCSHPTALNV